MARIGLLYLRKGQWKNQQLVPADFIAKATCAQPELAGLPEFTDDHGNASEHYGLLWWNNADGTLPKVPRNAFWSWGLHDSLIVVIPDLDIVASRAGQSWNRDGWSGHYEVLAAFFNPIVAAAANGTREARQNLPPYPPGKVITDVRWDPPEKIVRLAPGSDNWPMTWGDDDLLYTAYGDGRGFRPFVDRKLSLGLATVSGHAAKPIGSNLRSPTAEALGDGRQGRKASGLLMIDGTLYMLARNTGNSQVGWSADHGQTWTWADWSFETSFGCPTFLNFGRDYAGARDDFVYVYSFDSDSAYQPADRYVLARVPRARIGERSAYEFFVGLDETQRPQWTADVDQRGSVFDHAGRCYRSGITWNAGLQRYLWCQSLPESTDPRGPRYQGGFGIYDAAQPWGPWTTVFFTNDWDVGPGESSALPTKWISADGRTAHLVCSGDDAFSVRRVVFDVSDAN